MSEHDASGEDVQQMPDDVDPLAVARAAVERWTAEARRQNQLAWNAQRVMEMHELEAKHAEEVATGYAAAIALIERGQ